MSLPADFERVLLVKPEVAVYKIGPRPSNKGYRAADWNLGTPDWSGRMRIVSKGDRCIIRLEDKVTGQLFGECPIDEWPSIAVETVLDSCRYFVIRLSDVSGRYAFIGIGFTDRGDSFDFNVAISDHFKWLKQSQDIEKEEANPAPKVDLSLKEGQTITINLKSKTPAAAGGGTTAEVRRGSDSSRTRGGSTGGAFSGILPPPPGTKVTSKQELGPLFRAAGTPMPHNVPAPSPIDHLKQEPRTGNLIDDDWGAFSSSTATASSTNNSADWVSFS